MAIKLLLVLGLALFQVPLISAANYVGGCADAYADSNYGSNTYICECNSGEQLLSVFTNYAVGYIWEPYRNCPKRPDLESPICKIFQQKRDLQAPGLYFVSPYQQAQESVYIYDNDGNLVWTGFGGAGAGVSHAPQVCNYKGEPHLCFYQGKQMSGWGHGHGIIMDKHYRIVKSVEPTSYQASSDMHEFIMLPDGKSVLMTQYLRSVQNLCQYGICDGLGYVLQSAFQEVDIETGKALFEWRSLDHVDLDENDAKPGTTEISGSDDRIQIPWDYFHINSVDKNADGDYLISARHISAIYKISGKDGHIIWRLNSARSDYYLADFQFSFQHDARWVSEDKDKTVITLFDNGSNGSSQTQPWSTGLMVEMDHNKKTAKVLKRYEPPALNGSRHISISQGSYQGLKNGNVLLGWGAHAFWTEYTENGTVVFYGSIGGGNVMNYRVHKFDNWVGLPLTKPALWTYSKTGFDEMVFYVSWNGATEVKKWLFHTSESKSGPWSKIGTVDKDGFETHYRQSRAPKYSYVDALDQNGEWLGSSEIQELYVPVEELQPFCDEMACRFVPTDREKRRQRENDEREQRKLREAKETASKRFRLISGSVAITLLSLPALAWLVTRAVFQRQLGRFRVRLGEVIAGEARGQYRSVPLDDPHAHGHTSALDDRAEMSKYDCS